jgi:hypothetical protein
MDVGPTRSPQISQWARSGTFSDGWGTPDSGGGRKPSPSTRVQPEGECAAVRMVDRSMWYWRAAMTPLYSGLRRGSQGLARS